MGNLRDDKKTKDTVDEDITMGGGRVAADNRKKVSKGDRDDANSLKRQPRNQNSAIADTAGLNPNANDDEI